MSLSSIAVLTVHVPATVGAGTDETWEMLKTPAWISEGEIIEAWLSNGGALTGHATNYTTVSIYNTTQTASLASRAVDTPTTDNVTADTPWSITVDTTAANKKIVAGDAVRARKTDSGTGMALTIPVTIQGNFLLNGTYD